MAGGGRTEQEARDDTIAAFELALLHVGCNPASTPLWQKYLDYIKSWEERSPLDKGNKMTAIRKARGEGGYVRWFGLVRTRGAAWRRKTRGDVLIGCVEGDSSRSRLTRYKHGEARQSITE